MQKDIFEQVQIVQKIQILKINMEKTAWKKRKDSLLNYKQGKWVTPK